MLILGVDTSGRQGSVALLRAQADPAAPGATLLTLELAPLAGGQASEVLVPAIAALLLRHGLEKGALELIAVASGPGSFTGLRVAIATAKGLAEAFAIPVVPVSVLQAVALTSGAEGNAFAAIDAQRGEVFFGEYILAPAASEPAYTLREDIAGFADFAAALASVHPSPRIFTPDEALAARLRESTLDAELLARPSAEDFARIAYRKFLAGVRANVVTLDANYLRRSDAEISSSPKPTSLPYLK